MSVRYVAKTSSLVMGDQSLQVFHVLTKHFIFEKSFHKSQFARFHSIVRVTLSYLNNDLYKNCNI